MRSDSIHVLIKLAALLCLTIAVRHFNHYLLLSIGFILVMALLYYRALNALRMLKRLRWLLLTMWLVYAFNTPGEYLLSLEPSAWGLVPTFEGLQAGFLQCLRLIVVVCALALLLANTSREVLIGGLYSLFKPLSKLKLDAERFAVRLWLTLHYVENDEQHRQKHQQQQSFLGYLITQFDALNSHQTSTDYVNSQVLDTINIEIEPLKKSDYLTLILLLTATLIYTVYF